MGYCCLPLVPANIVSNSVSDAEFKIPEKCDECGKTMIDTITKFKGVASCVTDSEYQKIAVTGSFDQEKLLKKLKKVTCDDVEIVVKSEKKDNESEMVRVQKKSDDIVLADLLEAAKAKNVVEPNSDELNEMEKFLMLTDENLNAKCTIS